MTTIEGNDEFSLPDLWESVDISSNENQSLFFRLKILELGGLAVGAGAALIPASFAGGAGPAVSLAAFFAVIVLQASRAGARAESRWYDARAAAESIKSASWQYAVGGEAFRLEDANADSRFSARLAAMLANVPKLNYGAESTIDASITADMKSLRSSPRSERASAYRSLRIEDQIGWYSTNAQKNRTRARVFNVCVISVESIAVVAGLVRFKAGTDLDVLGALAALAAGLIAWTQAKKYTLLAESYALTSHEINILADVISGDVSEEHWAQSVHDAEAAFSREHTMWQARRQGPG